MRKGGKRAVPRQYEWYGEGLRARHPEASVVRRGGAGLRPAGAPAAQGAGALTADDVAEILGSLERSGVACWVDGGWGIDALLGVQTRPHGDLDLALAGDSVETALAALTEAGFEVDESVEPGLPARLVLRDPAGREVDLHPLVFDEQGNGWQDLGGGAWGLYPADGLAGRGSIGGLEVRCLTSELHLRHHLGWSLTPQNRADLERLAERFDLPLPPG